MRSELRILLSCLQSDVEASGQSILTGSPVENFDWDYFGDLVDWHGVGPLVAQRLIGNCVVPPKVVDWLRSCARMNAMKNLRLSAEFMRVSAALGASGISSIAYKGVVLSQHLYGGTAQRSVSDIDLIVRPEDVLRTIACLEELGFEDGYGLSASERRTILKHFFEYGFARDRVAVDLHWRVVQYVAWPSLDAEKMWDELISFQFYGEEVQVFSPEWMLVILCLHAAQHQWMHLKMFADIARLLSRHPELEWQVVEGLAADSHSRRSLLVSLSLASSHLGVSLPMQMRKAIDGDGYVVRIADRVSSQFWPSRTDPTSEPEDWRWMLFRTQGEDWIDRLRYVGGMAFGLRISDFRALKIPSSLAWMHYLIRPIRVSFVRLKNLAIREVETR